MVSSMYKSVDREINFLSDAVRKQIKEIFEGMSGIINFASKAHPIGWLANLLPQGKSMSKEIEAQILDPIHICLTQEIITRNYPMD